MEIIKIVVGDLETNCYILKKDGACLIIDPGDNGNLIKEKVGKSNILGILITHNHFDHVGALPFFKEYNVYSFDNLNEQEYNIGCFKFKVINTPGHTSDSISFYFEEENVLFSGDFLFKENVGRWDLETGDFLSLKDSINKIKLYPKGMKIYPGHGQETSLLYEIENNIYFK